MDIQYGDLISFEESFEEFVSCVEDKLYNIIPPNNIIIPDIIFKFSLLELYNSPAQRVEITSKLTKSTFKNNQELQLGPIQLFSHICM